MRKAVFVLGMHRSGTSALARVLNILGLQLPKDLLPAKDDNETGFWETRSVVQLNEEILGSLGSQWKMAEGIPDAWLESEACQGFEEKGLALLQEEYEGNGPFLIKDPRICILAEFWIKLVKQFNASPFAVIISRNPLEIAASLKTRDDLSLPHTTLLWLKHVLEAERHTRDIGRCFVTYDQLLEDWETVAAKVATSSELVWKTNPDEAQKEINLFLSDRHRHHRNTDEETLKGESFPGLLRNGYLAWQAIQEEDSPANRLLLDKVREEFEFIEQACHSFMREKNAEISHLHMRIKENSAKAAEEMEKLREEIRETNENLYYWESKVSKMQGSFSWKATSPLRWLRRLTMDRFR